MTRGSREWVLRALLNWSEEVGQGLGMITFSSTEARDTVQKLWIEKLRNQGKSVEVIEAGKLTPEDFVQKVAQNKSCAISVHGIERLFFGESGVLATYWVNFKRENLTSFPGIQVWWMTEEAATLFGVRLPDLRRFFLFRESLSELPEPIRLVLPTYQHHAVPDEVQFNRAKDLAQRALQAAKRNADPSRIWDELGIPSILAFLLAKEVQEARKTLMELEALIGPPLAPGNVDRLWPNGLLQLAAVYGNLGYLSLASEAAESCLTLSRQNFQITQPGNTELLIASINAFVDYRENLQPEQIRALLEEAIDLARALYKDDPEIGTPILARQLAELAFHLQFDSLASSLNLQREAIELWTSLFEVNPEPYRIDLANAYFALGDLERESPLSRSIFQKASGIAETLDADHPLRLELMSRAVFFLTKGGWIDDALAIAKKVISQISIDPMPDSSRQRHSRVAVFLFILARTLLTANRVTDSIEILKASASLAPGIPLIDEIVEMLGVALHRADRFEDAISSLQLGIAFRAKIGDELDRDNRNRLICRLSHCYWSLGKIETALSLLAVGAKREETVGLIPWQGPRFKDLSIAAENLRELLQNAQAMDSAHKSQVESLFSTLIG